MQTVFANSSLKQVNKSQKSGTKLHTRFIIEGGEADEHLDVDFSAAVDEQPEVLGCQVFQGILGENVQQTLPHCLSNEKSR